MVIIVFVMCVTPVEATVTASPTRQHRLTTVFVRLVRVLFGLAQALHMQRNMQRRAPAKMAEADVLAGL